MNLVPLFAVLIAVLPVPSCSTEAPASASQDFTCEAVPLAGQAQRCENDEAVCYLRGESLSCLSKVP